MTVTFIDFKANLSYVAVPGLSPYCFLRANLNNTSPFTILAGPANIFLVNNFIAKVCLYSWKRGTEGRWGRGGEGWGLTVGNCVQCDF